MIGARTHRPTILVIDDEPMVRRTIARLLERAGYEVHLAANGLEAMELVRDRHFDVAICDLNLGSASGASLCEQIWLAAPELAGHIIVSSGDLNGDGVDELVQRSGVPPMAKPFTGADLLRAVAAICPSPAMPIQPEVRKQAS